VLWGAIVVGFLAIAVSGPVAMLRERPAAARPAAASPAGAPATTPVVRMENIAFVPATLTVRPGTKVRFENRDVAPHTVTAATPGGIDSGTINPGRSFELVVSQPFNYVCTIHPSMKAKILLSG